MWVLRTAGDDSSPQLTFRVGARVMRTVGRTVVADFVVDAPLVSRVHCRLTTDAQGNLEVEDLRSTNGTFVNGRRVRRSALTPGDRLRVGRTELVVERAGREGETPGSGLYS